MEQAIKIAIENGLEDAFICGEHKPSLLDPLFWQALGKGLGWYKGIHPDHEHLYWKARWHSFIDHLAEGKDVDSFFTNLLTP